MSYKEKGQSTLEYVIVLTAIVGVILWAALGAIKPATQKSFEDINKSMTSSADTLANKLTF